MGENETVMMSENEKSERKSERKDGAVWRVIAIYLVVATSIVAGLARNGIGDIAKISDKPGRSRNREGGTPDAGRNDHLKTAIVTKRSDHHHAAMARCALHRFTPSLALKRVARWNHHGAPQIDFLKERDRWESLLTRSNDDVDGAVLYMRPSDWDRHLENLRNNESSPSGSEYYWLKNSPSEGVIRVPSSKKINNLLRFRSNFDSKSFRSLTSNMNDLVKYISETTGDSVQAYSFEPFVDESELTEEEMEECLMAYLLNSYSFNFYKTKPSSAARSRIFFPETRDETMSLVRATYFAQDLISTPACDMTPLALQRVAEALVANDNRLSSNTIIGTDLLDYNGSLSESRGCGMIYNVGRAAKEEHRQPRLICMKYRPSQGNEKTICLVGKGVTYDTGGLNLKPGASMLNMKKDMGGAAHVLGLTALLVEQDFPHALNVYIPVVENVMDGDSYRPGDILTSVNGTTTEIGNTDAEGRLILGDALALASGEESTDLIVDFATLTGAARVALGTEVVPFFSNNTKYGNLLVQAAREAHDPVWQLPLWEGYRHRITSSSKIADLRNVPSDNGLGGAITAALYLQEFVGERDGKEIPWIHLDVYGIEGSGVGKAQGLRAMYRFLSTTDLAKRQ